MSGISVFPREEGQSRGTTENRMRPARWTARACADVGDVQDTNVGPGRGEEEVGGGGHIGGSGCEEELKDGGERRKIGIAGEEARPWARRHQSDIRLLPETERRILMGDCVYPTIMTHSLVA